MSSGHRRDPTAATRPLQWVTPGMEYVPEWNAQRAVKEGYYQSTVLARCVIIIADTIASLPFRVGPDPDEPDNYDPAHPLARLLGPPPLGPNPVMPASDLLAYLVAQYLVTGRAGLEIEGNVPTHLWPLVSNHIHPVPSLGRQRYYWDHFLYGDRPNQVRLRREQCFYWWKMGLDDVRQPESIIRSAQLDVSVAVMQDRFDYGFLRNGAALSALVATEAFPTDDDRQAFQRQWRAEYGGTDNAGKIGFIEANGGDGGVGGAVSVHTLGSSHRDAQAEQRAKAKARNIAIALGVPFSKLDASERTFSNAEEEDVNFYKHTIIPLARRLSGAINMQLAPRFGNQVGWFDFSEVDALQPVLGEQEGLAAYSAGLIEGDEWRYRRRFGPAGIGFVSESDQAGDAPGQGVEPAPVTEDTPPQENPPPAGDDRAPGHGTRDLGEGVTPSPSPEDAEVDHYQRRTDIWNTVDRKAQRQESIWAREFRRLFERQETTTLNRLTGKRGRQAIRQSIDADGIFDRGFWQSETAATATPLIEAIVTATASELEDRFDEVIDLGTSQVQEMIRGRANQLAGKVTDTTYRKITKALADGALAGEAIDDIAARVRRVFADASTNRSRVIARTQVISGYNESQFEMAKQLPTGLVGGTEWISQRDDRTREAHWSADGQVRPLGQDFVVGGESMAYPGDTRATPENTVQCRCTTALLTVEEFAQVAGRSVPLQLVEDAAREYLRHRSADQFMAAIGRNHAA